MSDLGASRLTVDLNAYAHNLAFIRDRVPDNCTVMPVIKANGYGLGAVPLARRALHEGHSFFAVATVEEGIVLREALGEARILILFQPPERALPAAIEHDLRLMISDLPFAEVLGDLARKAKKIAIVHCEIDTGMGRYGFSVEEAPARLLDLTRISNVDIEGIATHFPVADLSEDFFTAGQIKNFRQLLKRLEREGIPFELTHAANSAAIVNTANAAFDMVRPGLMTCGVWPTDPRPQPSPLQPVATWTSRIALVKDVPGGASIGYGRTYRAPNPRRVGLVPVGYADGYQHRLSNRGEVLVRAKRCPVRGRVSMDSLVVDLTEVPDAVSGDTVVLLGADGDESISVEELAKRAECIPYEILTGIGPRVAREYRPS